MRRVAELAEWVSKHPDMNTVITHGLVPAAIIPEIGIPDEVIDVLSHPNVLAEVLFPAKFPDYPYPEGQQMLRRLRDRVGADKLLWGTDSPVGLTMWCTYLAIHRLHPRSLRFPHRGREGADPRGQRGPAVRNRSLPPGVTSWC